MKFHMKKYWLLMGMFLLSAADLSAQCAMCRSTLQNNVSQGEPGIAAGINTGILYLLVFPYLLALLIGYLWYRHSQNHRQSLMQ